MKKPKKKTVNFRLSFGNCKGMAYIKTAAIILVISMLFSVMLFYAFAMSTVSRTRDDTQRVLDSFCTRKSIEIYGSIKNGNNHMVKGTYTNEFMANLVAELGITRSGNNAFYSNDSGIIFRYNSPLTANLINDTLNLTMNYEIVIPVSFAGETLVDLRIPQQVQSTFVLKS